LGGVVDAPDFELKGISYRGARKEVRSRTQVCTEVPDVPPQEQEENNN
jgi:hypothetical protein